MLLCMYSYSTCSGKCISSSNLTVLSWFVYVFRILISEWHEMLLPGLAITSLHWLSRLSFLPSRYLWYGMELTIHIIFVVSQLHSHTCFNQCHVTLNNSWEPMVRGFFPSVFQKHLSIILEFIVCYILHFLFQKFIINLL